VRKLGFLALALAGIALLTVWLLSPRALLPVPEEKSASTPPPSAADAAVPTAPAIAKAEPTTVGREAPELSFRELLARAQESLPTVASLRALPPSEVHHTPKLVADAGATLGAIAEEIEKNPSLAPEGREFYEQCAKRGEVSTAVRAVCLRSLRELGGRLGTPADEEGIPSKIRRLADELAD
jgi:hypothetical protein